MQEDKITQVLNDLQESCDEIHQVMLISTDGLALCQSESVSDYDLTAALCTELRLSCDTVLSKMEFGKSEELFVRSQRGCLAIWPVMDMLLVCICSPSQNSQRLQMLAWKGVVKLNAVLAQS